MLLRNSALGTPSVHDHGLVIRRVDRRDVVDEVGERDLQVLEPQQRERDVLGLDRRSVGERRLWCQVERVDRGVVVDLPRLGQVRDQRLVVGVQSDQRLVERREHELARVAHGPVWIERREVHVAGDDERRRVHLAAPAVDSAGASVVSAVPLSVAVGASVAGRTGAGGTLGCSRTFDRSRVGVVVVAATTRGDDGAHGNQADPTTPPEPATPPVSRHRSPLPSVAAEQSPRTLAVGRPVSESV